MGKSKQPELVLQGPLVAGLKRQGWYADKLTERFKSGRPDLRVAHGEHGQLDVELKVTFEDFLSEECDTGIRKLQWLKIKEMNNAGIPTVGLVYSPVNKLFFVTTVLRTRLFPGDRRVISELPRPTVIDAGILFYTAMEHLNDLGYPSASRHQRNSGTAGVRLR